MKTPYLLSLLVALPTCGYAQGFEERDGLVSIEAEAFASQSMADVRRWFVFDKDTAAHSMHDADEAHVEGASGGAYLEILPDTRTNHSEKLIKGENFSDAPGVMCVLTYPFTVTQPGRYYIWGRAFSTGPEDNGAHFGIDGKWPESSRRLQLCAGKGQWTWSSAQRRPENHCGDPLTLWVDIEEVGQHMLMVSMREDGFELDKIVLALDEGFVPEGEGPEVTRYIPAQLPEKSRFVGISSYREIWTATENFEINDASPVSYYVDKRNDVLAINAAKIENRGGYARASVIFKQKSSKRFDLALVTMTEVDGESDYRVLQNGKEIGRFKNPVTSKDYEEAVFTIKDVTLNPEDVISVESNAVTNGKVPEGDGTAYSRGRWIGLVLQ